MNRRGFIKALAATVFIPPLCSAPPKLLAKQGPVYKFEYDKATETVRPNPKWVTATHEIYFLTPEGITTVPPYALRFHSQEDAERFLRDGHETCCAHKIV
jgi:hypothetical protein